jgi:hypothetical protein
MYIIHINWFGEGGAFQVQIFIFIILLFYFYFLGQEAMSLFDWPITKKKKKLNQKSKALKTPQYRSIHSKHRNM